MAETWATLARRAFIDPKALPVIVVQSKQDFEAMLAKARHNQRATP